MHIFKKAAALLLAGAMFFAPIFGEISLCETYGATTVSMSSYRCTVTDLRGNGVTKEFGNNGAVIVYGPTWDQVGCTFDVIEKFINCTDIKNFDYYYLGSGSDSEIISFAENYNLSDDICVINYSSYTGTKNFFNEIYRNYIGWGNSYMPPIVIFADADGNVYDVIQGSLTVDKLLENVEAMGIETNYKSPFIALDIQCELHYDMVEQILKRVNEARAELGVAPVSLDSGLMDAAMQRAAECFVYYDHTRPDLTSCFSIFPSYSGSCAENIAVGYRTADSVMDGWISSSGHYKNLTNASYNSIGIGAVYVNGQWYWAQAFGSCEPDSYTIESNCDKVYTIKADPTIATSVCASATSLELEAGDTYKIQLTFTSAESWSGGTCLNSSYIWSSDSDAAAVDAAGIITAKKAGTAIITGTNSLKTDEKITITVNVTGGAELINGLAKADDGNWYYYVDGVIDTERNGLVHNADYWWYVVDGMVKTDYTGFVTNAVATWYVVNGKIDTDFTGLGLDSVTGKWYGVIGGKVDMNYTGIIQNAGYWWYVENGVLNTDYTGFFTNAAGTWYISAGKIDIGFTGLGYNGSEWLCVKNGRYYSDFTGIVQNAGVYWYVVDGHLGTSYTGMVTNAGYNWYVIGGKVATNYTGVFIDSNGTHNIVNGKEI